MTTYLATYEVQVKQTGVTELLTAPFCSLDCA